MLLRESSEALGEEVELGGAIGRGDGGIQHGELMVRFAESATRGSDDAAELRGELIEAMGGERFCEVAATVGIFNGLVRVADAIGIPLDDSTLDASTGFRSDLGLNEFAGAGNTDLERAAPTETRLEAGKLLN